MRPAWHWHLTNRVGLRGGPTKVKLGTGKSLFPWRFRSSPAQFRSPQALPLGRTSRGRHGPAIDDILCPGDGGGARRSQKRDKIGYLARLCRAAKRNAPKRVHHNLAAAFVVGGVLSRDLLDQADRTIRLDPAG